MRLLKDKKGFTIIELMISTAVFSVVLLLCAMAIVQVGRMFYKGVTINKTQDTSRKVADDVIQAIQFGANSSSFKQSSSTTFTTSPGSPTVYVLCLGDVRYSFIADRSLGNNSNTQTRHILWKDLYKNTPPATCIPLDLTVATPSVGGEELVGSNMRVPVLNATLGANNIWSVNVTVAYGDTADLFTSATFDRCIGSNAGGQFCAVSAINSNVVKRL